jgi:hypothetical protein
MRKTSNPARDASDELKPEHAFDYSKAKANPYATQLEGRTVALVLEPDVAAAFPKARWSDEGMRPGRPTDVQAPPPRTAAGRPAIQPKGSARHDLPAGVGEAVGHQVALHGTPARWVEVDSELPATYIPWRVELQYPSQAAFYRGYFLTAP